MCAAAAAAAAWAGTSLCISQSVIIVRFRANNDLGCRLYLKLDILTRLFKSLLLFWRTNQQPATSPRDAQETVIEKE